MFSDAVIVQSAVSAFNNAALVAPAFLWWTILAVPIFIMAHFCGNMFLGRIGWNQENILNRVSIWTIGLTFLWVVLFGGNYTVLRDGLSALPLMTAVIVFLTSLFLSSHLRGAKMPRRSARWIGALIIITMVGLSDLHTWWGPLLQIGALVLGAMLGRAAKCEMRPIAGTVLILTTVVVAILMQPEFFRFGQLGNLTVVHLLGLVAFGVMAMAVVALHNVNPRGRIHRSAFVKLKWLVRFLVALGVVLFIMTEAVPIFLGTMAAVFILFAMSVWHSTTIPADLGAKCFAMMLMMFGMLTVMPAIVVLGILYWGTVPKSNVWREMRALL